MKYSHYILITTLLVVIFTISTVSANDTGNINSLSSDIPYDNSINNQELITEESFSNLNDEIISSTSDSKILSKDYKYDTTTDHSLQNGIVIDKNNFTIDGQGHTINADNKVRIFNITGNNIVLKNIRFINAVTQSSGGALYLNTNNIDLINCTFINNTAYESGGAIFVENSFSNNIIDSVFKNNSAKNGGAIYFNGSVENTTILGSFEENYAERAGGAIYVKDYANHNLIKSEFVKNKAEKASGGAIFFHKLTKNNNFESIFRFNEGYYGAGMFFYNQSCDNIFNSDFRYNNATSCGGAMFFHNVTNNNLFKGYFINNTGLTGNGGAITFKDTSTNSIFICDFINNTAGEYGGGVNYRETPFNITFNSNFINNKAYYGGAICVKNASIENTSLINNTAAYGGAIYTNGTLLIKNSNIVTNHADNGGAVYANNTIPTLYDCLLVNNTINTFNAKAYTYNCNIIEENDSESEKNIPKKTEAQYTPIKYVKDITKQIKDPEISDSLENDYKNTSNKDTYTNVSSEKTSNFYLNWIILSIIILVLGYGIWKYKRS